MRKDRMSKDGMGECRGRNAVTESTQTTETFLTQEDQLLPRIPNDITLHHISTKLPWRALYIMSLVSPRWLEAIRSGRVYDARVRTHSVETLVVHAHLYEDHEDYDDFEVLALYSMTDGRCYELPPIPACDRGIPFGFECVSLDGRIYVLGGSRIRPVGGKNLYGEKEVYVLDLACQRQWMQCASMAKRRTHFACGIVDGKIYVFGGSRNSKPARGSEVYNPMENVWSPIMPNTILRGSVASLGQELLLYGGLSYSDDNREWNHAMFSQVYNPEKNEWRVIDEFGENPIGEVFVAQGKVHLMTGTAIYVHETEKNSWRYLHSSPLDAVEEVLSSDGYISTPLVVNDELYVSVTNVEAIQNSFLSIGFGSESKEIRWQILPPCSYFIGHVICNIHL